MSAALANLQEAQLAFEASSQRLGKARVALRAFHQEYGHAPTPELEASWERELLLLEIELDEATRQFRKSDEDLQLAKRRI
jgi:hypothetical protein